MKKKTSFFFVFMIFLISLVYTTESGAEVNVNIGINVPPPAVMIPAPPPVMLIPETYVYFIPDIQFDIFFYHGYWYRPHRGYWYFSRGYNGPWVYIVPQRVPHVLHDIPPDFRRVPPGHHHIPYGQLKKHWRTWEREQYWDKKEVKHREKEWQKEEKWEHKKSKGKGKDKNRD